MQLRKNRLLATVAATAVAGLGLAGCTGTPPSADDGGSGGGGTQTIQFWHRTFTPAENEWYADIVKKFNAAQDDVEVVDTEVPADAWDQKMKAAQAAGKAPDVYTHSGPIQDAVNAAQLHELNGIVSDDALGQIIDTAKPVSELDGKYYAYPLLLEPQTVLFWNKDMVEKAGLDPETAPATWDDLMAACAKIKPTLAKGQYCISPAQDAVTFAWSTVGQQYNFADHLALQDDWTAPNIDDPGYRALMGEYKQLWDNGYMPKQPLAAYVEGKDFGQEKVAFKVSGSWMLSEIGSDYEKLLDRTGIGKFPTSEAGNDRTTTTLGNFKWVVDAKSQHAEAAGKFLEWAIAGDPQNVVPFFVDTQFTKIPVRQSVQDAVAADQSAADAPWSSFIVDEVAPDAITEVNYPWDVSLAVGTAMEKVMKGAAAPDAAIKTANSEIDTVIKREDLPSKVSGQ